MSDILIRGMEMPQNAFGCEVIIRIQPNGEVLDLNGFHIGAHAVSVPTHGRLVDADALKDLYHYNTHDSDIDKAWTGNIRRSIDAAPTIIPASEEGET